MPLVINLLQPVQEGRFHELTKRESAPIEIKAKTFTGAVKNQHKVPEPVSEHGRKWSILN